MWTLEQSYVSCSLLYSGLNRSKKARAQNKIQIKLTSAGDAWVNKRYLLPEESQSRVKGQKWAAGYKKHLAKKLPSSSSSRVCVKLQEPAFELVLHVFGFRQLVVGQDSVDFVPDGRSLERRASLVQVLRLGAEGDELRALRDEAAFDPLPKVSKSPRISGLELDFQILDAQYHEKSPYIKSRWLKSTGWVALTARRITLTFDKVLRLSLVRSKQDISYLFFSSTFLLGLFLWSGFSTLHPAAQGLNPGPATKSENGYYLSWS